MSTGHNFLEQVSVAFQQPAADAEMVLLGAFIAFFVGLAFYSSKQDDHY